MTIIRRKTINGHPVAFHLDDRLDKLEFRWRKIQELQDKLADRFSPDPKAQWDSSSII